MKSKFASYLVALALLAAVAFHNIPLVGQSPNSRNSQSSTFNSNQAPTAFAQNPPRVTYSKESQPSVNLSWSTPAGYPALPSHPDNQPGPHRKHAVLFIDKDGSIKRIEKEQGAPFSQEELKGNHDARQEIQSALAVIKSPEKSESERKESKQLIAKYLRAEFQWDQDERREQLERLQNQVQQIKKQLTKREESQDKLIELRMQLLENDAAGLSFPDSWSSINQTALPPPSLFTHSYSNSGPNNYDPTSRPDAPPRPSNLDRAPGATPPAQRQ